MTAYLNDLPNTIYNFSTLVELLRYRGQYQPDQIAYTFLQDGETESSRLTYGELDQLARAIAASLQSLGTTGDRALLLYPPSLEFISAFFGCLYAGIVAVPAYPPRRNQNSSRLEAIVADAQATFALTTTSELANLESRLALNPELAGLRWLATDKIDSDLGSHWREQTFSRETLAFLQYTSGSTGKPKGVMVSHGNILHNERLIQMAFGHTEKTIFVGWLPLFHDMGLIGNVLQPLYLGIPSFLMSPVAFLQQPVRWLQAISRYKATTSGGPNFAYELCASKITDEQISSLDLRSWDVAFNGSEPIRAETLQRFARKFADCGFRWEAFYPCYGMAETTLFVSGGLKTAPPVLYHLKGADLEQNQVLLSTSGQVDSRTMVGCGLTFFDKIAIVDPESKTQCLSDKVGEIWVSGSSVAQGYWNRPEATEETFNAFTADTGASVALATPGASGPFLRTGDLGFFHNGELFVTGRLKDMIIIRGRNHYPQDIELTLEKSHPALRLGCSAAFGVEVNGEERLVVACEVERSYLRQLDVDKVVMAIRSAISEQHEIQAYAVLLLKTASIPKTSSGKIQRHACRVGFLNESLDIVGSSILEEFEIFSNQGSLEREVLLAIPLDKRQSVLEAYLQDIVKNVLRVESPQLDRQQPLNSMGIDSLMAVELQQRIEADLGLVLPMTRFLEGSSIEQLATAGIEQIGVPPIESIKPVLRDTDLPLSFAQARLWFLDQLEGGSSTYNEQIVLRLIGSLDLATLEQALAEIVRRHEILRTTFPLVNESPVQLIAPILTVPLSVVDLRQLSEEEQYAEAYRLANEEQKRPFDLANGSLLHLTLLLLGEDSHVLLLTSHHIICDGWSMGIFIRELSTLYNAFSKGVASPLPELPIQFADFAYWQRQWLSAEVLETQLTYWKQQLGGNLPVVQLPTDEARSPIQNHLGGRQSLVLSKSLTAALKALSQREGATLFMTLLAAFKILLFRYTGKEDIIVGTPIVGRNRVDTEALIGCFINTLALRTNLSGNPSFRELLARIREVALGAYAHQNMPFEKLVEELQPERNLGRNPVFDVMFNFINTPQTALEFPELTFSSLDLTEPKSKFSMSLYVEEHLSELSLQLVYQCALFSAKRMTCLLNQFEYLLEQIVAAPDSPLQLYSLVTPASRPLLPDPSAILPEPRYELVTTLFTSWVNRTPEQLGVCQGDRAWTYQELAQSAHSLARVLLAEGVCREDVVAVFGPRSFGLIASMMAVLLSGGVLLTLDQNLPTHRRQLMLEQAKAKRLLYIGSQRPEEKGIWESLGIIHVTPDTGVAINSEKDSSQAIHLPKLSPDDAAYIFFTSGTTGVPKGVLGTSKGISHFLNWQRQTFAIGPQDRIGQLTGLSFDVVLRDIFLPLTSGATLCLPQEGDDLEPTRILSWLEQEQITVLHTVPTLAQSWLTNVPMGVSLRTLRWVFFAGEPLRETLVRRWRETFPEAGEMVNFYGPTETTLAKCCYHVPSDIIRGAQPVGLPLPETQALILSENNQLCGISEPGEIVLRTPFRSLGYINAPEENLSRFVKNPFRNDERDLFYHTGDIGRYRLDGSVEILGRLDHQVKIRGIRIEPGEIETVLDQHPTVQEAVVIVQLDHSGDQRLVAYVVPTQEQVPNKSELRRFLREQLPEYMIPAAFVVLETLPLTSNGKVDRRALPTPDTSQKDLETSFVSPRTSTEEVLANLWTDILGVDVGIHDNFFELGGHSLLATQLISRVREAFSVELPLRCLFESPTIAELSETIEMTHQVGLGLQMPAIKPVTRNKDLPLSFAQERLWFLHQLGEGSTTYNEQVALRLIGCLHIAALKMAIQEIVQRHEVLRTTFKMVNGSPVQVIAPNLTVTQPMVDLQALPEKEQSAEVERLATNEAQQPFDLAHGPLLRVRLLQLGKEVHILLLTMHHIISDGWSMNVFNHEMSMLYEAFSNGKPSLRDATRTLLPVLPIQYADFAIWERTWLQGDVLETQLNYWKKKLEGVPASLDLPTDYPRPQFPTYNGSTQYLQLPQSLSEELKALTMRQEVTLFMTLCAVFQILLYKYSGQKDFVIATSEANRNIKEVESLIGFFVNQVLFRSDFHNNPSFQELLKRVRKETLSAYENKHLPFSKLVQEIQHERDLNCNPLFQVLFIFHNTPKLKTKWTTDLEISPLRFSSQRSRLDSMISILEQEQGLFISWEYSTDLFEEKTIQFLLEAYQTLLEECIRQPEQRISEFHLPDNLAQIKAENIQLKNNFNNKKLHHLGFACRNIHEGIAHIRKHYHVTKISDIIFDELQNASVCLIETENGIALELVSGHQVESLLNRGVNLYHVCYEVSDIFIAIEEFESQGASLVSQPKPAKLFNNRLVAFLNTTLGLVELLEKTKSEISEQLIQQSRSFNAQAQKQTIAITATFTSDMVEEFLVFWMQELGIPSQIEFASYNQVFQQLLNPSSQLSQNKNGINVVLVRFEDWQKYEDNSLAVAESTENVYENIERNVQDLVLALKSSARRSATPHLVCLCPASPQFLEDSNRTAFLKQMQQQMIAELVNFSNIHLVTSSELTAIYPVSDYYDPHGNELGHVPYTPTFFSALGTMIARKISKINTAPYKVIVLDCDQTLWQGICGEDGALGVEIDPPRQAFQEFMVAQQKAGKLICLCSKNDESDVWAVFEHHQSMPLKREHLVSWRINWKSKSENIQSIANELQLGLDSFIFIDDNPVECAEVQANCPEVLTIQLPQQSSRIPEFLKHIWAFDNLKVTKEDLARTELYRQNVQRERWREESLTFADFLAGLRLQVGVNAIVPHQLNRVSQLTQRTNQLNFTTIRRSEGEIQQLCESGKLECLTVEVKDRFGDYGLVGTIMFESGVDAITVDTFLLSCRVLGRGVEYKMLAQLGDIADERRLRRVDVFYVPTQKNQSALDFLDTIGVEFKQKVDRGWLFRFPVELITQLTFSSSIGEAIPASDLPPQKSTVAFATQLIAKSALYQRIATELYDAAQVLNLVKSQKHQERSELKQGFVEPRSSVEELVAGIWRDILNLAQVGIHDNFFELGGHSLLAIQVISRLQEAFCVKLPLLSLFQKPTVAGIAEYIERIHWTAQLQTSTSTTLDEREEIEL